MYKINQCLDCEYGEYNNSDLTKAILTGSRFQFCCSQRRIDSTHVTIQKIKRWHNSCGLYLPKLNTKSKLLGETQKCKQNS